MVTAYDRRIAPPKCMDGVDDLPSICIDKFVVDSVCCMISRCVPDFHVSYVSFLKSFSHNYCLLLNSTFVKVVGVGR